MSQMQVHLADEMWICKLRTVLLDIGGKMDMVDNWITGNWKRVITSVIPVKGLARNHIIHVTIIVSTNNARSTQFVHDALRGSQRKRMSTLIVMVHMELVRCSFSPLTDKNEPETIILLSTTFTKENNGLHHGIIHRIVVIRQLHD